MWWLQNIANVEHGHSGDDGCGDVRVVRGGVRCGVSVALCSWCWEQSSEFGMYVSGSTEKALDSFNIFTKLSNPSSRQMPSHPTNHWMENYKGFTNNF